MKVQPTTEQDVAAPSRRSLVLQGQPNPVFCLAALSRRSLVLQGHTAAVSCLVKLDGGRLASGSTDKSIIIWSVADGKQLAKLEGHTGSVWCLAALDGGRLASGSGDRTIRVRPLLCEAIDIIVGCDSTFDFEEAARGFRETNELGDLFAAAVQQFDEKLVV